MSRKIFLTLPVKNLEASKAFYSILGFGVNPQISDRTSAMMTFSEEIFLMLLTHEKFREFAPPGHEIVDATKAAQVLVSLCYESKDEVNRLADAAVGAGASTFEDAQDHGFMYGRSFQDLDGHGWQLMWMDTSATASSPTTIESPAC